MNNLRKFREKRRMTQGDLALLAGVSRQSINSIEQSRSIPSVLLALKLAHVLGGRVEKIFELEGEDLLGSSRPKKH